MRETEFRSPGLDVSTRSRQSFIRVGAVTLALVVLAWICFLVGVPLADQHWTVVQGQMAGYSPGRHRAGQVLLVVWIVLDTIAFLPAYVTLERAYSGRSGFAALGLLAACSAMPIFLVVLAMTGYLADTS
jgi:hypothetical protein